MRKLIIGLIAVGFVASLFLMYALIMDPKPIVVKDVTVSDDLEMPQSSETAQKEGEANFRDADKARFVVLNPQTKEISQVFGFEKLLNPGMDSSRRDVEKPYLIFYESKYHCRVESDRGVFQIESSKSSSAPKDVRLYGNVKIHIIPKEGSGVTETVVEMDDLVYSSERSEFATDHRVHIISEQAELTGTGLVVLFDSAGGSLDYFYIRDIEEIRLQSLKTSKSDEVVADTQTPQKTDQAGSSQTPSTGDPVASIDNNKPVDAKPVSPLRYYQCKIEDNVVIKYGTELIVTGTDEVNIQNVLLSKLNQNPSPEEPSEPTGTVSAETAAGAPKQVPEPSEQIDEVPVETTNPELLPDQSTTAGPEVIITCDGGLILEPMKDDDGTPVTLLDGPLQIAKITTAPQLTPLIQAANFAGDGDSGDAIETDTTEPMQPKTASAASPETPATVASPDSMPPTEFRAQTIDYNLKTGCGLAHGPIYFKFYQESDPNSPTPEIPTPVIITADKETEFVSEDARTINQVIFKDNVLTVREAQTQGFTQIDNLHSDKLTVDLNETQDGSMGVSQIKMTEGKVYIESQRIQGDREISKVKLYCSEITYNQLDNIILAEGSGRIEFLNNGDTQTTASGSSTAKNKPSVAMVDDFKTIHWDMNRQTIVADGDQATMKLAYYPIIDGRIQKQTFVYSMQLRMSYLPSPVGLQRISTDKAIIYEEWNSDKTERQHYIIGQTLDYDATDENGWMKIAGTPAAPCNVDGARMPEVYVHPVTGAIKAAISTRPGILRGH